MAFFIFINGAYGAGKTQTAFELLRRLDGAHICDLEEAGYYIRRVIPDELKCFDFRDHAEWRGINNIMLRRLAGCERTILLPMTVTDADWYREITDGVTINNHIILRPSREVLAKRIASRHEGKDSFAARMADRCYAEFDSFAEAVGAEFIDTSALSISEAAEEIARSCGLTLSPRASALSAAVYRLRVTLGHIR